MALVSMFLSCFHDGFKDISLIIINKSNERFEDSKDSSEHKYYFKCRKIDIV